MSGHPRTASLSVSVCVPAYQAERFLRRTITSVLGQNFHDFELIVLDNASADRTAEVAHSFRDTRIRVVRNTTRLDLADNWNRIVELCGAPLVKVLCADDLMRPDCLRVQQQILASCPEVALVACRRDFVDDTDRTICASRGLRGLIGRHDRTAVTRRIVRDGGNPVGEAGSVMFRREHFDKVGGFDGRLLFPMDLDLWLRLLDHGDFYGTPESLAAFRISAGSLSGQASHAQYQEQRTFTRQIGTAPGVRTIDRAINTLGAPVSSLCRRGLFRLATTRV
jgi:glycosyltransferase involved in cell wall biosynthesis